MTKFSTLLETLVASNHPAVHVADRKNPREHAKHVHRLVHNYLHMPRPLQKRGVRMSSILSKHASPKTLFATTAAGLLGGYLLHDETKRHGGYAAYIFPHKYYVYRAARQLGVPVDRAAKHDASKLTPHEWLPWSAWFNGPKGLHARPDRSLYLEWKKIQNEHQLKNEHHWRQQGLTPAQVPMDIKLETIADWYGVNRATGATKQPFKQWYAQHRDTLQIDNQTKEVADRRLGLNKTSANREALVTAVQKCLPGPDYIRTKIRSEQDFSTVAKNIQGPVCKQN
jgi:Family of unknown function (DUF5662)